MKNFNYTFCLFITLLICSNVSFSKQKDAVFSPINPFVGKVITIDETIDDKADSLKRVYQKDTDFKFDKDTFNKKFIIYCTKNGFHLKQTYYTKSYDTDYYVDGGDIYEFDSLNPIFLNIYRIDSQYAGQSMRFKEFYFSLFELPNIPIDKITKNETENSFILTWSSADSVYIYEFDKKTRLPIKGEVRRENGELRRLTEVSILGDVIKMRIVFYGEKNEFYVAIDSLVKITDVDGFEKSTLPSKLGFREVIDNRWAEQRRYVIVDKPKSKEFIENLFKNEDDVERYNSEMARFSPIKCNHEHVKEK